MVIKKHVDLNNYTLIFADLERENMLESELTLVTGGIMLLELKWREDFFRFRPTGNLLGIINEKDIFHCRT